MKALALVSLIGFTYTATAPAQDEHQKMQEASAKIGPVMERAEALVIDGRFNEANDAILATFPESTRSPVECLVLGNVLFKSLPDVSYKLHKTAASGLPGSADALLEWALEQHRAAEYAGAAKTYDEFLKLKPDYAPALGLLAECRLRTADVDGAVTAWKASENARTGSIEDFESLVCEVHGPLAHEKDRSELLAKAAKSDMAACEALLLLDLHWSTDWWNDGPAVEHLKHDLPLVRKVPDANARLRAAVCAAEIALDAEEEKPAPRAILTRHALLIDKDRTVPENGATLSILLNDALESGVMTAQSARNALGARILELAKKSKDAEAYNAAAHLYVETDRLAEIDQEAWEATHDPRFAASLLVGRIGAKQLAADDPLLIKAVSDFPENSEIARVAFMAAVNENKPLEPSLIRAIKAEFSRFSGSAPGVAAIRPSAMMLRAYFRSLEKCRAPGAVQPPP